MKLNVSGLGIQTIFVDRFYINVVAVLRFRRIPKSNPPLPFKKLTANFIQVLGQLQLLLFTEFIENSNSHYTKTVPLKSIAMLVPYRFSLLISSCARFRVQQLSGTLRFSIKNTTLLPPIMEPSK